MNYYNSFNITKREILFSIIIVCVMLIMGFIIHDNINDSLMLKHQEYNMALQVEGDAELFVYGMNTNIGKSFIYGDLKAVDTVTYPELNDSYSYVEKIKEKYTRHTRTKTVDGKTETEVYYTWDIVDREHKHCEKISFLGVNFNYDKIKFPSSSYIATQKVSSNIRYVYYGTDTEYVGTIYTELKDGTINNTSFHVNKNIDETIEGLESDIILYVFWISWIILIGGCVFGFYYIDNKWLEDNKR